MRGEVFDASQTGPSPAPPAAPAAPPELSDLLVSHRPARSNRPRAEIYLDANATTSPSEAVIAAVVAAMQAGIGNPASAHLAGNAARRLLEAARDRACLMIPAASADGVIFVSGGTEANNTILRALMSDPDALFLVAPTEHSSVLQPLERLAPQRIRWLAVDSHGRIDPDAAARLANSAAARPVLAVQSVNSETGVVQPLKDIVEAVRKSHDECFIHLDAAQAIGRIRLPSVDADSVSFSGHKIHGPCGTGVLYLSDPETIQPLLLGGGQEHGKRSGTPNLPGIVGMGAAIAERSRCFDWAVREMALMRDSFENSLFENLGPSVLVNGGGAERVANTSNLRFPGLDGMQLMARLSANGVMASQGSACSSGRPEPSRVLTSMGLTEREAFSSLRFSFSILNTRDEALEAAKLVASVVRELR